ncbi:MAG: DUF648 domain-containing protein [Chlamydiales bacterium]
MTAIPLFTPIHYERPRSSTEGVLSTLSHYFYLGGTRATVVKGNEVRLETGKVSWHAIALKVASYILLFPLTLTLLAINLALRCHYSFTVITPSQPRREPSQEPDSVIPQRILATMSPPAPAIKTDEQIADAFQREPEQTPPSVAAVTALKRENVDQQVIAPPSLREVPFHPHNIQISDKSLPPIASLEEMRLRAHAIGQLVLHEHTQLRLMIPSKGSLREQTMQFVEELRSVVDVIETGWENLLHIEPKKIEESQGDLTIRYYNNGVIEEVQSAREDDWSGRRIHPNGVIETGRFEKFILHKGIRVENKMTVYRHPDTLLMSDDLDRGFIYTGTEEEKQLIVVHKKPSTREFGHDYVQVNEELFPTLAEILKKESDTHEKDLQEILSGPISFEGLINFVHKRNAILKKESDIREKDLREILSGPINCEEFVKFLFETNAIFSLDPNALQMLLKIIQEKGLAVNLHQQHTETKETLLVCYLGSAKVLKTLLTIDPTLIQRTEGMEVAFVRALLAKNKKGASKLFSTMEKQHIAPLPRELLFKKVAFSEGEVTLEELQTFSQEDQEIVYRLANIYSQLNIVKTMRTLGFGRTEELLMREGPSIFGGNMDALEMHEHLHGFLTHLRSQNLLLTQSEFDQLPPKKYKAKGEDIGCILGRDYIERKANELGLIHVKLPKKIIVIDGQTNLKLRSRAGLNIEASSDSFTVYAEKIKEVDRTINPEEVSELLRLFEATGFSDIHWENIIVAEDGVYIIDSAFTNFWVDSLYFENGHQYVKMAKIVHALPVEQQQPFIDELNAKIATYCEHEEELIIQQMIRAKEEQAALERTGCSYGPSFTFSIEELIEQV